MSTQAQDQMAACAAMGQTTDQHKSLARFAGKWRAEVKHWMDPTADPMVSTGTMTNTMVLGDKFLQEVYEDDAGMFSGKGFWGFNTTLGRFEGFWIDSMATFFHLEQGVHDPMTDTYTMTGSMLNPMTRQPMTKRSVITYKSPNEHQMEMFFSSPGMPEMRSMIIRYTRH